MTDIRIHRCIVRIRRKGGFGWDLPPRELVDAALAAIQRALMGYLPHVALPDGAHLGTVRIPVRLTRAELVELALAERRAELPARGGLVARIGEALRVAVAQASPLVEVLDVPTTDMAASHSAPPSEPSTMSTPQAGRGTADLRTLLIHWHTEGELGAVLRLLPPELVFQWIRVLERDLPTSASEAALVASLDAALGPVRLAHHQDAATRLRGLRYRLVALVHLTAAGLGGPALRALLDERLGPLPDAWVGEPPEAIASAPAQASGLPGPPTPPPTWPPPEHLSDQDGSGAGGPPPGSPNTQRPTMPEVLESVEDRSPSAQVAVGGTHVSGEVDAPPAGRAPPPPPAARRPGRSDDHGPGRADTAAPLNTRPLTLPTALPFLALGPLSRCGYLAAAQAVFSAAKLTDRLPLFGTALAFKSLDPPQRGWLRSDALRRTAAAAGGFVEPVPEPALADLARQLAPCLPALDALLARNLLRGHDPAAPFILHMQAEEAEEGVLFEPAGLFPIAAGPLEHLITVLSSQDEPRLLIAAECATPERLARLDAAHIRFLTDAPPTRREPWRRVAGLRFWSNLARPARDETQVLRDLCEEAALVWQALRHDRPASPPQARSALDRSLSLAAGVALADLAHTLWKDHEPTSPLLPLRRFGDLDARVTFTPRAVEVRIPLGRRHQDLFFHDCLRPVRDVPWFSTPLEVMGA